MKSEPVHWLRLSELTKSNYSTISDSYLVLIDKLSLIRYTYKFVCLFLL